MTFSTRHCINAKIQVTKIRLDELMYGVLESQERIQHVIDIEYHKKGNDDIDNNKMFLDIHHLKI